jgi:hypothetical protein
MVESARQGAAISIGIDHENYTHRVAPVGDNIRAALLADLV